MNVNGYEYGKLWFCMRGFSEGKSDVTKQETTLILAKNKQFFIHGVVFSTFLLLSTIIIYTSVENKAAEKTFPIPAARLRKGPSTAETSSERKTSSVVVLLQILGTKPEGIEQVIARIESMLFKPEVGSVYEVKVIKMLDFGAVVEYVEAPGNEVLLHVSELAWERTDNVSDVVKMGDILDVKYFGLDPRTRKEKVSRKAILPKPEGFVERPPRESSGRDNRNGGRDNRGSRDNRGRDTQRDDRRDDRKPREEKKED